MKRRRPTTEDLAMWRKVAETAEPLHGAERKARMLAVPSSSDKKARPGSRAAPPTKPEGGNPATTRANAAALRNSAASLNMDRKTHARMTRGKLRPESRLDLHGLTLDQAHPRLARFILRARADGKRLVLVITGKGRGRDEGLAVPTRGGLLRRQVPHWLAIPPLNHAVLQVSEAHASHGGSGAFYVYLRRLR